MVYQSPFSDTEERKRIFRALVPHFGKVLPAGFFKRTPEYISDIQRVHNLIEGIFKPAWSTYALSIRSMLVSRYHDKVSYNPDRSWRIFYSPKSGGLEIAQNAALTRGMVDREPVLVLRQETDKTHRNRSQDRLLGLGFIERFDVEADLFHVRGLSWEELSGYLGLGLADDLIPTALRLESLEEWTPFVAEERAVYQVASAKRDVAFRQIVLENYNNACAVTGLRFHSERHTEADGAHIIAKDRNGTDDPRNGVALSKTAHWAFDRGIFTISDQFEIVIHPKARHASVEAFPLMEMDRKQLQLPSDRFYWPHAEALAWHKSEVFDRFEL